MVREVTIRDDGEMIFFSDADGWPIGQAWPAVGALRSRLQGAWIWMLRPHHGIAATRNEAAEKMLAAWINLQEIREEAAQLGSE